MVRIAVIRDESVLQADDASRILLCEFRIVRHHDDEPVFRDLLQQLHNLHRGIGVQGARRLIRQENIRVVHQGAGNGDTLHLSAGHLVRFLLKLIPETDPAQSLLGTATAFGVRHTRNRQRQLHICQYRLVRDQVIGLEDKTDGMISVCVPVRISELSCRSSVDDQVSGAEAVQSADDIQKCGLAAAGMTQDRNELALTEFEIDSLERVHPGIGNHIVFFDVSKLQHALSSSAPSFSVSYYIVSRRDCSRGFYEQCRRGGN